MFDWIFQKYKPFEVEGQKQGYVSAIFPYGKTLEEGLAQDYEDLKKSIHQLIEQGILRKRYVHFVENPEYPHILFKYTWLDLVAIFDKHFPESKIDMRRPGYESNTFAVRFPWRLKLLCPDRLTAQVVKNGLEAFADKRYPFEPYKAQTTRVKDRFLNGEVLEDFYRHYKGVVFGESHSAESPRHYISHFACLLKRQHVEHFFVEHLADSMQPSIDQFCRSGKMPKDLEAVLNDLDTRFGLTGSASYKHLFYALQKERIHIHTFETAYSNHIRVDVGKDYKPRMAAMNYLFQAKVEQVCPKPYQRWAALVGSAHLMRFYQVPGVCEIVGALAVRIEDDPTSKAVEYNLKPKEVYSGGAHISLALSAQDLHALTTPNSFSHKIKTLLGSIRWQLSKAFWQAGALLGYGAQLKPAQVHAIAQEDVGHSVRYREAVPSNQTMTFYFKERGSKGAFVSEVQSHARCKKKPI